MTSPGRDTFGLGPHWSSDCKTIDDWGAPRYSLASGAFPGPVPWWLAKGTWATVLLPAPFFYTGYTGLIWVPMGLVVCQDQTGPERAASWLVVFEQTKPLQSFGSLVYFSGWVWPFQPYPYYWKLNKPIGVNHSLESEDQRLLSKFCAWCMGQTGLWNAQPEGPIPQRRRYPCLYTP